MEQGPKIDFAVVMTKRTKAMAIDGIKLVGEFPNKPEFWVIGKQLLKAGTSVAANYRATTRGRSDKEFLAKLTIVVEECDEVLFWLELLEEASLIDADRLHDIKTEATELLKILAKSKRSLNERLNK